MILMLALVAAVAPPSTSAGIVTSIATVITALGGLVLAVGVLIPILRTSNKTLEATHDVAEKVQVVHTLVNQQKTDGERFRIALVQHSKALEKLLAAQGIPFPEIPVDQSLPVPGEPDAEPGQPRDADS
jgi:hypothetical protein